MALPTDPGAPYVDPALQAILDNLNGPHTSFPDYAALVEQYLAPYQQGFEAQMQALRAQIEAQMGMAQQQGEVTQKELSDIHGKALQSIDNNLGARGLADSGDADYLPAQENKRYESAKTGQANQLLQYLTQLQNTLTNQQLAGLQGLQQQRLDLMKWLPSVYQPTTWTGGIEPPGSRVWS